MQSTDEPRVPDHDSDPAHVPGDGWVDEGGASHLGPATHIYAANEGPEPDSGTEAEDPEQDLGRS